MKSIFILFFIIIFVFVIVSYYKQAKKNEKLVNSLTDKKVGIRGNIIEISKTEFRLDYYDIDEEDSHSEFLVSEGYQGGGPSWAGIIYGAIKMSDPELFNEIRFDPEAQGLAIWSSERSILEKIGRLISTVKSDDLILAQAIKVAKRNWQME